MCVYLGVGVEYRLLLCIRSADGVVCMADSESKVVGMANTAAEIGAGAVVAAVADIQDSNSTDMVRVMRPENHSEPDRPWNMSGNEDVRLGLLHVHLHPS